MRLAVALCACVAACVAAVGADSTVSPRSFVVPLKRHGNQSTPTHRDLHFRRLAPMEEVRLFGYFRTLAYYYAEVFVGTPPQKVTAIADTGSTLLAFPCKDCTDCGVHQEKPYDATKSTTSKAVSCGMGCPTNSNCASGRCTYSVSYAEGSSIAGNYYQDTVWIGDGTHGSVQDGANYGTSFRFGCHTKETRLFRTQSANGIMGLSQDAGSLISTLWDKRVLRDHVFSMCLTFDGGAFVLGGIESNMHTGNLKRTPLTPATNFYTVTLIGGILHGEDFDTASHSAIVDSGTTFTYLPQAMFRTLETRISAWCAAYKGRCAGQRVTVNGEGLCYKLTNPTDISTFPELSFRMQGGEVWDLPQDKLFVNMVWDSPKTYCLSVYSNGHENSAVLGANIMMGHDVVFDLTNRTIGWAFSGCNLPAFIDYGKSKTPAPAPPSPSPSSSSSQPGAHTGDGAASASVSPPPLVSVAPSSNSNTASVSASGAPVASTAGGDTVEEEDKSDNGDKQDTPHSSPVWQGVIAGVAVFLTVALVAAIVIQIRKHAGRTSGFMVVPTSEWGAEGGDDPTIDTDVEGDEEAALVGTGPIQDTQGVERRQSRRVPNDPF